MISTLALVYFLILIAGCEHDVDRPQIDEIEFALIVLDEAESEAVSFDAGTDIRIGLKLLNNSNKDLEWAYEYMCILLNSENFLLVSRRDVAGETDSGYVPIGTPYLAPVNCLAINYPSQRLPPGESIIIEVPWSNNTDNKPLPAGSYYVRSNFGLEINDHARSWLLSVDFEIL
jgi:hypothetical protein